MYPSCVCVQMDKYIQQWAVCSAELEYLLFTNTVAHTGLKENLEEGKMSEQDSYSLHDNENIEGVWDVFVRFSIHYPFFLISVVVDVKPNTGHKVFCPL